MREIRAKTGMTQKAFSEYLNIPVWTIQDWEGERRTPPDYVVELIEYKIIKEELGMMKRNSNGKYDVLNQSNCERFEVDRDWLENVDLRGIGELRFTTGTKDVLEAMPLTGPSEFYENVHGSWARTH